MQYIDVFLLVVLQVQGSIWWTAYNKVKHQRTTLDESTNLINFTKANLLNVSNAYAALYLLEKTYLSAIADKSDMETLEPHYFLIFPQTQNKQYTTIC